MTDHRHKSPSSEWHPSLHTMAQVALAIQHTKSWQPRAASPAHGPSPSPSSSTHTSPTIPQGPCSPHSPAGRRYSWSTEDRKHAYQMHGVAGMGECPGFTEHFPGQKKQQPQQQQQYQQQQQQQKGEEKPEQNNREEKRA